MVDNARPPVAVRIVRPYLTEEAFLESELETVGKTSVILIGAHARPAGVILRFEVTITSGLIVLRGEGRVLAHKENAFRGQPGLALRFTRLDPRSKALVDRAAEIREARLSSEAAPGSIPPPAPPPASMPPPASVRPPASIPPGSVRPPRPGAIPSAPRVPSIRPTASGPPSSTPRPSSIRPSGPPVPRPVSVRPPAPPRTSSPPDPALTQILTSPTPSPPVANRGTGSMRPDALRPYTPSRPPPSSTSGTDRPARPSSVPEDDSHTLPPHGGERPSIGPVGASVRPPMRVDEDELKPPREKEELGFTTITELPPELDAALASRSQPPPPVPGPPLLPPIDTAPPAPVQESIARASPEPSNGRRVTPPLDRDRLLARLRDRATKLTDEQRATILRGR